MHPSRIAVAAAVIAAVAAPSASAAVAVDRPRASVEASVQTSRFAEMAAHREGISNRHWQQARNAPVVPLVRSEAGGFDWASALIGGSVPIALLLVALLARPAVTRRRTGSGALA